MDEPEPEPTPERPDLRAVADVPVTAPIARPAEAEPARASEPEAAPAEKPATDESQVKKRRAAFRVIDGGG